jgi:type IV pilus assembly protein PilY1
MASRRFKWITAASSVASLGVALVVYNTLIAAQAQGVLAQAPLNNQVQTAPAFIMAVDDSGSMTFQTQFPGQDGEGCWNTTRKSFFDANGSLYTSGNCDYLHVLPGPRIDTGRYGIPPIDMLGFARSSQFNPTYYNPSVKYEPWVNGSGVSYGDAGLLETRIDPRATTTVALASPYYSTASADSFRMQDGMVIPAGTFYRYNNTNYQRTSDYTWNNGVATVYMQYTPATFYVRWTAANDPYPQIPGATNAYSGITRVKVDNACGTNCAMWRYTIGSGDTAALQNFANWFSYYGNRNRAMIAGMTRSLSDINNLRVGYFRINQNGSYDSGTSTTKRLAMRDMANNSDKLALYTDMTALTASGGTPNRQAVNAAALQMTRTDAGAPVKLMCQKNAVMLFTDGFSNGDGPTVGNTDSAMGAPFSDGNANTMADIVTKYYNDVNGGSPLRTDLTAGKVPVPQACKGANPDKRLDCQPNLHINFYGVTLGARGNLFNPDLVQDPYTDASIYGNWPPRENDQRSTVDDIWHATVNTRGEYINARTPEEITTAMRRVLSSVTSGASPSGGSGSSGARVGSGSISISPSYEIANEGTDWFGRLTASKVSTNAAREIVYTSMWEAAAQLTATGRQVFFTKDGTTRAFTAGTVTLDDLCTKSAALYPGMSRCNAAAVTALGANITSAVAYLKGDQTGEVKNGGKLRDRTTRLGDIVNSSPVVSAPGDDYGYRRLGGTLATSYQAYVAQKKTRANYMVYVGANDGMLHAFNGGMDAAGNTISGGGTEAFAYIPSTALGHMGNLLFPYDARNLNDQKFDHRYYVDGKIALADSNYGGDWHTTLVGASGAGGRSVFALDVTPGTTFGTGSKLWEISDLDAALSADVRNNIGHVLANPVIVPMLDSSGTPVWRAVFGNGYNSANGKAVLFMVDIKTGTPTVTMIEAVESGAGVPTGSNGLGSVVVVDRYRGTATRTRGTDGYADTAYAADQKGAVWKFDLRAGTNLTVPLFTSRSYTENGRTLRQPIIGGLESMAGESGGNMLFFGTGSFSFVDDPSDTSVQSLYGLNDTVDGQITTTLTRANLTGSVIASAAQGRGLTRSTAPTGSRGWYVDLPGGERFVGQPSISEGDVYMRTYVPSPTASGCASAGTNWTFVLQALTGNGALGGSRLGSTTGTVLADGTAAVETPSTGSAAITDVGIGSLPSQGLAAAPPGGPTGNPPTPNNQCWAWFTNGTAPMVFRPYPCGRQSWRQIQ